LERAADGASVTARVPPAMIPISHPLASVREAFNAVFVEGEAAGGLMFYGPGAGVAPTAWGVVGDVVAVARNKLAEATGPGEWAYTQLPV
ncbi:homoserine dehydrogenase, partial [Streptomyces virginiae]